MAYRTALDGSRAEIEQAEATLRRPDLSGDELQELRTRLDPVAERLRDQLAEIGPKLDAARAQLEQIGPKPKDGAPAESPEAARNRLERESAVAYLDEINRLAGTLALQAEQLTGQISDRRRASFTKALFQRSYSLVSPDLWLTVAQSFPRDLRALHLVTEGLWNRLEARSSPVVLTLLGLAIGVGAALHIGRRHLAPRLVHRDPAMAGVTPFRKLVAAFAILIVETVPAAAGSILIYQALALLDVLPPRLLSVAAALLIGLAVLAFLQGLIQALFAPKRMAWRLIEVPDAIAASIFSLGIGFGAVVAVGRTLDALNQAIAAGLALSVATKAVVAAIAALTLALLLRTLADRETRDEACLGPYIPTGAAVAGPIRMLGWLLAGLVTAAVLGGYVAFASFLVDQIVWTASLAGLLCLALLACDRFIGGTLRDGSRVSTMLQANLGLRRKSLQQLGVLASGIARVVFIIIAAMLALAPWGVESGDLTANLRAAFFGFKVGDVTVSLSTTIAALLLFFGVIAVGRVVQRWLTGTFLPTTELDAGLRNSVATAAGYVGFFVAAAAAFGYLGLSLEKMAIVAGALSVGIGFGLQSIVNNFVSGLILLWERPIRVGDLVVVGDGEGYVRRISVRATEIETFDRSTIVVPNSNLISGVVKNRVRNDSTGRVVLPVNVLRNQDPARAAELLIACAHAHPDVLTEPPARVIFKKIGDTWLEFDLVCIVDDVAKQLRVQSDLNFAVFQTLVQEGILPPLGPGAMNVGGLEPVQAALQSIADAIGSRPAEVVPEPAAGASGDEEPTRLTRRRTGAG
ncbi:DUF3772 domain-containing protein [uncultured Enterovirga sp.]|uniref:DUF3772 domain-containing protein n=1 Tax=uncultured Enterovirga sp. TaxID=2026352 RepID=UPI0035C9C681